MPGKDRRDRPLYGRPLDRRRLVQGAGALAGSAIAAPAFLRRAAAQDQRELRYWNLFGGGDGARMQEMQQHFSDAHTDISLDAVTFSWGPPYYTKLAMSIVGGKPPAVAALHASRLPSYAPAGLIQPLDVDLLTQYEIGPDKFLPDVWEGMQFEGEVYAIPIDIHPLVMYFNTEICDQAGLLDADGSLAPIEGADQLRDAFRSAQEVTGDLGLSWETEGVSSWRLFSGLYAQKGGAVLSPDGAELTLDDGMAEEVLTFMAELTQGSGVARSAVDYSACVALFSNANAGFHLNGGWEVTTYDTQGLPYSAQPVPAIFGSTQVWADSHVFVLPAQEDDDEERTDTALRFISFMLNDSLTWAQGGHIPAYQPIVTSPDFQALQPQASFAPAAENPVYDPRAWFSGAASPFQEEAGAAFSSVVNGHQSPREGVAQFRSAMEDLLKTPSPI